MRNWFGGGLGLTPALAGIGPALEPRREEKFHTVFRKDQTNARRSTRGGSATQFRAPQSGSGMTRRAAFSLILLVLLPPLGMLLIWRRRIFQTRGRVLLTVLSALLLSVEIYLLLPTQSVSSVTPSPVKAALRTEIPEDDALNALSNMDELLAYGLHPFAVMEGSAGGKKLNALDRLFVPKLRYQSDTYLAEALNAQDLKHIILCGDLNDADIAAHGKAVAAASDRLSIEPQMVESADTQMKIKQADGVVLLVHLWKTKRTDLEQELRICRKLGGNVLGVAVIE